MEINIKFLENVLKSLENQKCIELFLHIWKYYKMSGNKYKMSGNNYKMCGKIIKCLENHKISKQQSGGYNRD